MFNHQKIGRVPVFFDICFPVPKYYILFCMISWGRQRQLVFVGSIGLAIALAVGIPAFLSREGSKCDNKVKDGNERGVDCGGSCRFVCASDVALPVLQFVRLVPLERGLIGAVAYSENRNTDAGVRKAAYLFKFYDDAQLLVMERRGTAYIPPGKAFAVFEGRIPVGSRTPTRAVFEWSGPLRFEKLSPEPALAIRNELFEAGEISRLTAELRNDTLASFEGIKVTALLFDETGNVFAAGSKYVPELSAKKEAPLSFTWPAVLPFPARIEMLYTVSGQ
ncbi:MAG: hypothetical protein Q7R88_00775 [bacterium]|nr:hypothetical protein [bacterium]